ncbi:MAG: dienelactone hydrolase family protein, partial [Syntrophorhabdaceae bacterium]|nr:dienelactone hydrolase family protein [Syntrophorhabdaceae bacterium]
MDTKKEEPKNKRWLQIGLTDRRGFLKQVTSLAVSIASAEAIINILEVQPAMADLVPKDDPMIVTESVKYPGVTGDIMAKLSMPKGADKLPGVIVIHENRGLNAHIEDVTRRVALEGFLALAPDALTPMGGTPKDEAKAISMRGHLDQKTTVQNFVAAVKYLKTHPKSTGKIGVVGFCWGGAMANQLAVHAG